MTFAYGLHIPLMIGFAVVALALLVFSLGRRQ